LWYYWITAIAGLAADAIGLKTIYYIAGAVSLVLGIAAAFIPSVMNLGKQAAGANQEKPGG
jgi:hypothetical protein